MIEPNPALMIYLIVAALFASSCDMKFRENHDFKANPVLLLIVGLLWPLFIIWVLLIVSRDHGK